MFSSSSPDDSNEQPGLRTTDDKIVQALVRKGNRFPDLCLQILIPSGVWAQESVTFSSPPSDFYL